MPITIFTDSSANLELRVLKQARIEMIPLTMTVGGKEIFCTAPDDQSFDLHAFYQRMRDEKELSLKTSMINSEAFRAAFEPQLAAGNDILYIGMSTGISGTVTAAQRAAEDLSPKYPERKIYALNTRAASLGEGLLVLEAAALRDEGKPIEELAAYIERERMFVREHFLVDDLMFLKRGGRISGGAALAGTILSIKPIMKGDEEGRIVLDRKIIGRKKALRTLADILDDYAFLPLAGTIGIAHGGCEEDALQLKELIEARHGTQDFMIVCYEPGTGAHVGPGTVALFFRGEENLKHERSESPVRVLTEKLAAEAETITEKLGLKGHKED